MPSDSAGFNDDRREEDNGNRENSFQQKETRGAEIVRLTANGSLIPSSPAIQLLRVRDKLDLKYVSRFTSRNESSGNERYTGTTA